MVMYWFWAIAFVKKMLEGERGHLQNQLLMWLVLHKAISVQV